MTLQVFAPFDKAHSVKAVQAETNRPPIIAHFPDGTLKAFCPCGIVITYRPSEGEPPPAGCMFCKRRYQWDPTQSGVEDSRKEGGSGLQGMNSSKFATASTPDSAGIDPDEPARSFVRIQRNDTRGLYSGPDAQPTIRPEAVFPSDRRPLGGDPSTPRSGREQHPALPPLQTDYAWRRQEFVVHPAPGPRANRITVLDNGNRSGSGIAWPCAHGLDQIGGRRCVRCCSTRGLSYVWRKPAGGSPGAFRWLCVPCEAVYSALGLVGDERLHVTNMANRARPVWVEAREV